MNCLTVTVLWISLRTNIELMHIIAGGGAGGEHLPPDVLRIIFSKSCANAALPVAATGEFWEHRCDFWEEHLPMGDESLLMYLPIVCL